MISHRRARVIAGLGFLLPLLVSSCGTGAKPDGNAAAVSSPRPASRATINMVAGVVPDETDAALYLAQQRGIFAAHGLHLTIKTIVSTQDAVPQLNNGSLDLAAGQLPTWVAAQASGAGEFRVLAPGVELGPDVDQVVALPTSRISNPGQLSGRVIAVNAAKGNGPLLTDNALATYGVRPTDVAFRVVAFPDMVKALAAHQVAAAYCTEPYCTEMAQQLGAVTVADLDNGGVHDILIGGYTVTASWLKKNPKAAAAFLASIHQAVNLARTDPDAVRQALGTSLHVNQQIASVLKIGTFPTTLRSDQMLQIAVLMAQYGEISKSAKLAPVAAALSSGP